MFLQLLITPKHVGIVMHMCKASYIQISRFKRMWLNTLIKEVYVKKKEVYVQTDINILWDNKLSKNEFEILQTHS